MIDELLLAGVVGRRAQEAFPAAPSVERRAVHVALNAFAGGASWPEACAQGLRYIESCQRHPSSAGATSARAGLRVA